MTRKVLTVLGHTRARSLCGALVEHYAAGAAAAGGEVRVLRIASLHFDPATPPDLGVALEPDLARLQESLAWADHLCLAYPNWWGGPPGLLRAALERVLLPGFAYRYHAMGYGWDRLLAGRSGELLVTMDTPPFIYKWIYRAAGDNIMARRTLDFCGIRPVRATHFGPVRKSTPDIRARWLAKAEALGRAAARA